ncbi:MAG: glutathione S-transferase family protein [Alphaproteobacteria bacterium]
MYTLHHNPGSQHARRVVSLLEEAGLAYTLAHVAMEKGEHRSPEYLAINPNHQVPTLIDGDLVLWESNAILRYLCTKHRLYNWYHTEPKTRARVDQWRDWNQCRFSPNVVDIILNKVFMGPAGDTAAIKRGEENLPELAAILEAELEGDRFLVGAKPTIADLSVASNISHLGLADIAPTTPHIQGWFARVGALEGFKKSLPQM